MNSYDVAVRNHQFVFTEDKTSPPPLNGIEKLKHRPYVPYIPLLRSVHPTSGQYPIGFTRYVGPSALCVFVSDPDQMDQIWNTEGLHKRNR